VQATNGDSRDSKVEGMRNKEGDREARLRQRHKREGGEEDRE
jgi:hypothetical protein